MSPRPRAFHTDLAGFIELAAAALETHVDEKERQLRGARYGSVTRLVVTQNTESVR